MKVVFRLLLRIHVNRVLKFLHERVDIVWSFDAGNLYPLTVFPKKVIKIYHPVDNPDLRAALRSAREANVLISVTKEILQMFDSLKVPRFLVNHGVSDEFLNVVRNSAKRAGGVRVGYSGNLTVEEIDRNILLEILKSNPSVVFEFWGSYEVSQSNIGGSSDQGTQQFIAQLKAMKNVRLHGVKPPRELAIGINDMDCFLICYDVRKGQSNGTNSHKVMEFLSTGKVIVSSNLTAYSSLPDLVQMVHERDNNNHLPALLGKVIQEIEQYNAPELIQKRIAFANENSYGNHLSSIEEILNKIDTGKVLLQL